MKTNLSPAGLHALQVAIRRPGGFVCPMRLRNAAQTAVLKRLLAQGYITPGISPVITEAGRAEVIIAEAGAVVQAQDGGR